MSLNTSIKISNIGTCNRKYPKFLILISFAELFERFSYHSVRAVLILYLTIKLGQNDTESFCLYSLYAVISYGLTIIFGIVADKFFGFLFMCKIGALITFIGHILTALSLYKINLLYFGIAFIATGTACFKGNIANLLSSCYFFEKEHCREVGFTVFYTFISIGGFLAYLICGIMSKFSSLGICFALAGVSVMSVILIFSFYHKVFEQYIDNKSTVVESKNKFPKGIFALLFLILSICLGYALFYPAYVMIIIKYFSYLVLLYYIYNIIIEDDHSNKIRLLLVSLFIFIAFLYYLITMQLGSFISLFLLRNVDRAVLGIEVPVILCQSFYPATTIIVGIIASSLYSKFNNSKSGNYVLARLICGLCTIPISFFVLYLGCTFNVSPTYKINLLIFFFAMIFISIGEILVTPCVVSQITKLSPQNKSGFMMGSFMAALSLSNLTGFYLAKIFAVERANEYIEISNISLEIYQSGFLKVFLGYLFVVLVFIIILPYANSRMSEFATNSPLD